MDCENSSLDGAGRRLVNGAAGLLAAACLALAGPAATAAAQEPVRLMVLGDSLAAGYGLAEEDAFTHDLEAALRDRGHPVDVLNAGVSGDTTAGGLARLDWALAESPDAVLVELGANDGLRGIDPAETRRNLTAIVERLRAEDVPVMLAGMYAPPNLGEAYGQRFNAIFPDLAEAYDVPLYDFFLDGVATVPALNQGDGIHPNARGVDVIVERIAPAVVDFLAGADLIDADLIDADPIDADPIDADPIDADPIDADDGAGG